MGWTAQIARFTLNIIVTCLESNKIFFVSVILSERSSSREEFNIGIGLKQGTWLGLKVSKGSHLIQFNDHILFLTFEVQHTLSCPLSTHALAWSILHRLGSCHPTRPGFEFADVSCHDSQTQGPQTWDYLPHSDGYKRHRPYHHQSILVFEKAKGSTASAGDIQMFVLKIHEDTSLAFSYFLGGSLRPSISSVSFTTVVDGRPRLGEPRFMKGACRRLRGDSKQKGTWGWVQVKTPILKTPLSLIKLTLLILVLIWCVSHHANQEREAFSFSSSHDFLT